MPNTISNCPFCGGAATLIWKSTGCNMDRNTIINKFAVRCNVCGIESNEYSSIIYQNADGTVVTEANGADQAIAAWNRRPVPEDD